MAAPTRLESLVAAARERADGTPPGPDDVALLRSLAAAAADHLAGAAGPSVDARLAAEVRRLALVDDLTGFHTRRAFFSLAEYGWGLARRFNAKCGLVYARVEVKAPADPASDDGVLAAARVLRQTLRDVDVMARIGPAEFAVFALTGEGSTAGLIVRLREALNRANKEAKPASPLVLAVGSVDLKPTAVVGLETLLAEAQRASNRP